MFQCHICGEYFKSPQGLKGHERLKHGIVQKKAAVMKREELYYHESPQIESSEITKLRNVVEELKRLLEQQQSQRSAPGIEKTRKEIEEVVTNEERVEKNSGMSLPESPTLPLPPFVETIKQILDDKFKELNKRVLFR